MERLCRSGAPPRHAVRHGYLSAPRRSENPARRFGLVVRALGQHDVVVADLVLDEALRVGRDLLVADHRVRCREGRNEVGVAAFQVPEVSDFIPYNESVGKPKNPNFQRRNSLIPITTILEESAKFDFSYRLNV